VKATLSKNLDSRSFDRPFDKPFDELRAGSEQALNKLRPAGMTMKQSYCTLHGRTQTEERWEAKAEDQKKKPFLNPPLSPFSKGGKIRVNLCASVVEERRWIPAYRLRE